MELGKVGLWTGVLDAHSTAEVRDLVQEIEAMGWPTLWRPEATGRDALLSCAHALDATTRLNLATGIAQIYARHPHTMAAGQLTLAEASGGRFLLGLGVSHAPHVEGSRGLSYDTPYTDMVSYLEAMKSGPFTSVGPAERPPIVLAALGPKMLKLSATAADGAHPYFSPPEHTAYARAVLGPDAILAPEQMVVITDDIDQGRELAAAQMARYLQLPNYANNLRRLGYSEEDITGPSRRMIDAIVTCGSIDAAVARVNEHHDAGADHVCIQVLTANPREVPRAAWRDLAAAFGLR